jgi:hypothetical protein
MLFLLITNLLSFIWWAIAIFLLYKIVLSFGAIK